MNDYLTFEELEEQAQKKGYWRQTYRRRWEYILPIIEQMKIINPASVLELGTMGITFFKKADTMGYEQTNTYAHNAIFTPWDFIPNKKYDVFIATNVFHHLDRFQPKVFSEIKRIAKHAFITIPSHFSQYGDNDAERPIIPEWLINRWFINTIPKDIWVYNGTATKYKGGLYIFDFTRNPPIGIRLNKYGTTRRVYAHEKNEKMVIKEATDWNKGYEANTLEWKIWNMAGEEFRKFLAPCVELINNGEFLIQARGEQINRGKVPIPPGFPSDMPGDLRSFNWCRFADERLKLIDYGSPVIYEYLQNNPNIWEK